MKFLVLALAAIALLAPAAASAAALPLECMVKGVPYANDVRIANITGAALAAGTRIKWTVTSPHATGKATLTAPLAAGDAVVIEGALIVGPEAGTPCAAVAVL